MLFVSIDVATELQEPFRRDTTQRIGHPLGDPLAYQLANRYYESSAYPSLFLIRSGLRVGPDLSVPRPVSCQVQARSWWPKACPKLYREDTCQPNSSASN